MNKQYAGDISAITNQPNKGNIIIITGGTVNLTVVKTQNNEKDSIKYLIDLEKSRNRNAEETSKALNFVLDEVLKFTEKYLDSEIKRNSYKKPQSEKFE